MCDKLAYFLLIKTLNKMKRLNYIILGLLTLSLVILTDRLHLSQAIDKLVCTSLWLCWLIISYAIYLYNTRKWCVKRSLTIGWIAGFAIAIERTKDYSFSCQMVLPFMVMELAWYKNQAD